MKDFKGYTHIISSVALYVLIVNKLNMKLSPPIVLFIILGSILPDIDCSYSLIGRYFVPINLFMKHRGITHSLFGMLLFSLPMLVLDKSYFIGFTYGYFIHLIEDSLTSTGIKPFQPFSTYKFKINIGRAEIIELTIFCLSLQYILIR